MAPRPTRTALRERYDRRRDEVVVAAARVFAEQGYDQTTMAQLAESMGLAAGALYHYFGGKDQLLLAICDELVEPLLARASEVLEEVSDPRARLEALVQLWVAHVVEHRDHMLVFQQERHVIEHGEQWRRVRTARKEFERRVEDVLQECLDARLLRLDDRRLALSALLGMVNHTAQWYRPRGRLTAAQIADGYVEGLLA